MPQAKQNKIQASQRVAIEKHSIISVSSLKFPFAANRLEQIRQMGTVKRLIHRDTMHHFRQHKEDTL